MKKKSIQYLLCSLLVALLFVSYSKAQSDTRIYGYSSLYFEKVGPLSNAPSGTKGSPGEFDYANLNIMLLSNISEKVRAYVNLAGTSDLEVRNYWGEYAISEKFKIRSGKIYRRFGQFNELLDAVPTYLGMEPPELFDGDHLMLPRTGKLMLHGSTLIGENYFKYAYMLDSDENLLASDGNNSTLSHTFDFNISLMDDRVTLGTSAFFANEANGSSVALGEGSPEAGILPWMTSDKYNVFGLYSTSRFGNITLKGAYFASNHDAKRDANAVATLYQETALNASQLENFFGTNYSGNYGASDVITDAKYDVSAWYVRLGYTIERSRVPGEFAEVTPYLFLDSYSNPETIASKTWGGDNEAGISDDGKFYKPTIGVAFRLTYNVALKIDASSHIQKINGNTEHYNEIRVDFSFMF